MNRSSDATREASDRAISRLPGVSAGTGSANQSASYFDAPWIRVPGSVGYGRGRGAGGLALAQRGEDRDAPA